MWVSSERPTRSAPQVPEPFHVPLAAVLGVDVRAKALMSAARAIVEIRMDAEHRPALDPGAGLGMARLRAHSRSSKLQTLGAAIEAALRERAWTKAPSGEITAILATPGVDPASVAEIVAMGFSLRAAEAALRATASVVAAQRNGAPSATPGTVAVEAAVDWLLEDPTRARAAENIPAPGALSLASSGPLAASSRQSSDLAGAHSVVNPLSELSLGGAVGSGVGLPSRSASSASTRLSVGSTAQGRASGVLPGQAVDVVDGRVSGGAGSHRVPSAGSLGLGTQTMPAAPLDQGASSRLSMAPRPPPAGDSTFYPAAPSPPSSASFYSAINPVGPARTQPASGSPLGRLGSAFAPDSRHSSSSGPSAAVAPSSCSYYPASPSPPSAATFYPPQGSGASASLAPPAAPRQTVGVAALLEREAMRVAEISGVMDEALEDLASLASKAEEMVALAREFRSRLDAGAASANNGAVPEDLVLDAETAEALDDLGVLSPVTKDAAGRRYHDELARQLSDFLDARLARDPRTGGAVTLPQAFCLYNRARGTDLVSPADLLNALQAFSRLGLPHTVRVELVRACETRRLRLCAALERVHSRRERKDLGVNGATTRSSRGNLRCASGRCLGLSRPPSRIVLTEGLGSR